MKGNTKFSGTEGADMMRGVRSEAWIHAERAKDEASGAFIK